MWEEEWIEQDKKRWQLEVHRARKVERTEGQVQEKKRKWLKRETEQERGKKLSRKSKECRRKRRRVKNIQLVHEKEYS